MHKTVEKALHQDFNRWTELVDRAAHGENEVEREKPALAAAELEERWVHAAAEDWRILHDQWCERIDRMRASVTSEIRAASIRIAEANCACEHRGTYELERSGTGDVSGGCAPAR